MIASLKHVDTAGTIDTGDVRALLGREPDRSLNDTFIGWDCLLNSHIVGLSRTNTLEITARIYKFVDPCPETATSCGPHSNRASFGDN